MKDTKRITQQGFGFFGGNMGKQRIAFLGYLNRNVVALVASLVPFLGYAQKLPDSIATPSVHLNSRPFDYLKSAFGSGRIFEKASASNANCQLPADLKAKLSKPGEGDKLTDSEKQKIQSHFECRQARLLGKLCYLGLKDFPGALGADYFAALRAIEANSAAVEDFSDGSKLKQKYAELDKALDKIRESIDKISGSRNMAKSDWDEALKPGENDATQCGLLKDQVLTAGGARCMYDPAIRQPDGGMTVNSTGPYLVFNKTAGTTLSANGCRATRSDGTTESTLKSCSAKTLCEGFFVESPNLECEWVANQEFACNLSGVSCTKLDGPQVPENPSIYCEKNGKCVNFGMGTWQPGCRPTPPSANDPHTDPLRNQKMKVQKFSPPAGAGKAN